MARGYSYRQLMTRPMLGGGFFSALAVPLIAAFGLPAFAAVSVMATLLLTFVGLRSLK